MQTILVIDDDDGVRGVIATALEGRFRVLLAASGREGIETARQEVPDLILCDLNMGEGGGTTFDLLRSCPDTAHVPFVLITGKPEADNPGDAILVKPFSLPELMQTIRRQLRPRARKRPSQASRGDPVQERTTRGSPPRPLAEPVFLSAHRPSSEPLEDLLARMETLREQERTQIARSIHDDLTQTLTVVAIELSLLQGSLQSPEPNLSLSEYAATIRKLTTLVHKLIRSAQELTARIRPKVLDEFGLVAALEWLAQKVQQQTGIICETSVQGPEAALPPKTAGELYRLSEEVLLNTAQHAKASKVYVKVTHQPGSLVLEIEDNGKGIDAQQVNHPASLGFLAMRERVERLAGTIEVKGTPSNGTVVRVHVPLNK